MYQNHVYTQDKAIFFIDNYTNWDLFFRRLRVFSSPI